MEFNALVRYTVGIVFLLAPCYFWWERWRTRGWPTTKARVIVIDAKSLLESGMDIHHLNLDSYYAIEYEVDGRKYMQTPDIENNVRWGRLKVARSPSIRRQFKVRYNASNPSEYSIMHVYSPSVLWAATILCIVLGLVALNAGP